MLTYMPDLSQNGWPVLDRSELVWFTAAGERFAAADANVAYVAKYLITRFNAEVEPIAGSVLDDWSYADRPVTGSTTTFSNHASATAWDLNALKHPRGAKGTYSSAEVAAVRKILAAVVDDAGDHVFRWGNDYTKAVIDSMHFEINVTRAQVAQARARLENEMEWGEKIKLSATDAKWWGSPYKAGDEVTIGAMLRYPTLARKTEKELSDFIAASTARDAAMKAQLDALTKAVDALANPSSSNGS
jgi:D-alanyl-D-alanine carboxypeptidase